MKTVVNIALILGMVIALSSCSSSKDADLDATVPAEDVGVLYNRAADALDAGEYRKAVELFRDVEREYPFSEWAKRAELMSAYALYMGLQYDDAELALDRYLSIHPGSDRADYALYLKAMTYYDQITDVARDQAMTRDALDAFNILIRRYPDSRYARDAQFKRDLTLDHLAGKEMEIGRYYLTRGHTNAAIGRFRIVVQSFQTTTHIPEALHRLVEAYLTLGLKEEALKVAAVLGHNYPGSKWYERSYQLLDDEERQRILDERDWMDKTVDSLFNPN